MSIDFSVTRTVPRDAKAVGIGVFTEGAVGRSLGIDRAGLTALGFEGKPGQAYVLAGGTGPTRVALGLGAKGETTVSDLRKSAAAFARAVGRLGSLATGIVETAGVDPKSGAQAVVEGATLGVVQLRPLQVRGAEEGHAVVHADRSRIRYEGHASRCRPGRRDRAGGGDGSRPREHSGRIAERARHGRPGVEDRGGTGPRPSRSSTRTTWSATASAGCSA